jgi:hypothetical protein
MLKKNIFCFLFTIKKLFLFQLKEDGLKKKRKDQQFSHLA